MFWPFWVIFKHGKYLNNEALRQTLFLVRSQKHHFFDHFTPESGPKNTLWSLLAELSGYLWTTKCAPNDQKGILGCGKAQINVPNCFRVLKKRFWNFCKIVEFATFRQHWLGQKISKVNSFKALNLAALNAQRDFYPKCGFGTHFRRVIKFVPGAIYS